jgi:RNA polymerase sigma-70 factor (ECF subfamily)
MPKDDIESEELQLNEIQLDQLGKAIETLKETERLMLELYYFQNQSIKEIAMVCSLTESHVKVLLHRTRQKLSQILKK